MILLKNIYVDKIIIHFLFQFIIQQINVMVAMASIETDSIYGGKRQRDDRTVRANRTHKAVHAVRTTYLFPI